MALRSSLTSNKRAPVHKVKPVEAQEEEVEEVEEEKTPPPQTLDDAVDAAETALTRRSGVREPTAKTPIAPADAKLRKKRADAGKPRKAKPIEVPANAPVDDLRAALKDLEARMVEHNKAIEKALVRLQPKSEKLREQYRELSDKLAAALLKTS